MINLHLSAAPYSTTMHNVLEKRHVGKNAQRQLGLRVKQKATCFFARWRALLPKHCSTHAKRSEVRVNDYANLMILLSSYVLLYILSVFFNFELKMMSFLRQAWLRS